MKWAPPAEVRILVWFWIRLYSSVLIVKWTVSPMYANAPLTQIDLFRPIVICGRGREEAGDGHHSDDRRRNDQIHDIVERFALNHQRRLQNRPRLRAARVLVLKQICSCKWEVLHSEADSGQKLT